MERLYLLFNGTKWGVYNQCTCPDPTGDGPFMKHWWRMYEVPNEDFGKVFDVLCNKSFNLNKQETFPTKENAEEIFPNLEDLLKINL